MDIAERLREMGHDPVESLVRIAKAAEENGNDKLAAKINGDLLEYIAPKLKSMEYSIDEDTRDFLLERDARRQRILELMAQLRIAPVPAMLEGDRIVEAEVVDPPLREDGEST